MRMPRRPLAGLPAGVRVISGRYVWTPTTLAERQARRDAGQPVTVTLAPVGAELQMRTRWAELTGLRDTCSPPGTVDELIDRYERDGYPARKRRGQPLAPRTRAEYARQLPTLRRAFGARTYARSEAEAVKPGTHHLRRMDIARHLAERAQGRGRVAANREMALLSAVFEHARDCGLTEYNPCQGAPRNYEPPRSRVPTEQEAVELFMAAPPVLQLMMAMVEITGMREGDLLALDERQVEEGVLRVTPAKTRAAGKTMEWERTPALDAILEAAKALTRPAVVRLRGDRPVFRNTRGERLTLSAFQSMWRRTRAQVPSAADLTFHDLRAWAISRRQEGKAAFAGHSDAGLTYSVYQRLPVRLTPSR